MLTQWIEIFKGGKQTDSAGQDHDGDALIDSAVSQFNALEHEPPAVIGHPKENAPAYAWVEGLKKEDRPGGAVLLAKFKDVVPEFEDMLQRKMFKKRSAAFYPDGKLRHVGFLGAMPPAVKGLKDMGFAAGEAAEFIEDIPQNNVQPPNMKERLMELKEFFEAMKFWKESTMPMTTPEPKIDPPKPAEPQPAPAPTFSEADLEKAKAEAVAAAVEAERQKMQAEFAEKEAAATRGAAKVAVATFCDGLKEKGQLLPAWEKMGIRAFMESLIPVEGEFQFSEGDKQTAVQWFKDFLNELPKTVPMGEFADRASDPPSGSARPALEFEAVIKAKMDKDPAKSWSQAFTEAQIENPGLVKEYMQTIGS